MLKGFKILDRDDCYEDILKYREQGALRGVYLGFPELHEKYTMSLPGITDWSGIPGSGKTELLLELLLNTSLYYGWKHIIYVPDVGDKNAALAILIHKITGKTFDKRFVNSNYISEEEVIKELDWVLYHFHILYKTDEKQKITPYEFWDMAVELNKNTQGGIQTATIDSWKDMKRYVGHGGEPIGRDDLYLEDVLNYRNTLSEIYKMHFHTVIHPLKPELDKDGKRKAPTPYELKGGPTWYDMGKVQVTVHRTDGTPNEVSVIVTKAKPETVASLGSVKMFFNKKSRAFHWNYNGNDTYAKKEYFKPTGIAMAEQDDDDSDVPF